MIKFIATKTIPKREVDVFIELDERSGKWVPKVEQNGSSFYISWNSLRKTYDITTRLDQAIFASSEEGAAQIANLYKPN